MPRKPRHRQEDKNIMQEEEHNSIQHGKPKQQNNYRTRSKNKVID